MIMTETETRPQRRQIPTGPPKLLSLDKASHHFERTFATPEGRLWEEWEHDYHVRVQVERWAHKLQ